MAPEVKAVWIRKEVHRELRIAAVRLDVPVSDLVTRVLREWLAAREEDSASKGDE